MGKNTDLDPRNPEILKPVKDRRAEMLPKGTRRMLMDFPESCRTQNMKKASINPGLITLPDDLGLLWIW